MGIVISDWPVRYLQDKLQGIYAGDLWIIGAFSGGGKSTLSRLITMNAHKNGTPVVLYSLENAPGTYVREEIRMMYNEETGSKIDTRAFKRLEGDNPERFLPYRQKVYENAKKQDKNGLQLLVLHEDVNAQNMSVDELLRSIEIEYQKGYKLFIIDHVDMLITDPKLEVSQTTYNMNRLWAYVAQRDVAFITFSQMATTIQNNVLCPGESDLRGVRTKGQRATGVITVARHDYGAYVAAENQYAQPTYIRIAKNRDGATGCAVCFFDTDHYLDKTLEVSCDKQGVVVDGLTKDKLIRFKAEQQSKKIITQMV